MIRPRCIVLSVTIAAGFGTSVVTRMNVAFFARCVERSKLGSLLIRYLAPPSRQHRMLVQYRIPVRNQNATGRDGLSYKADPFHRQQIQRHR